MEDEHVQKNELSILEKSCDVTSSTHYKEIKMSDEFCNRKRFDSGLVRMLSKKRSLSSDMVNMRASKVVTPNTISPTAKPYYTQQVSKASRLDMLESNAEMSNYDYFQMVIHYKSLCKVINVNI